MTTTKRSVFSSDHIYRNLTVGLMLLFFLSPFLIWLTGLSKIDSYLTAAFLLFALYEITRRPSDVVIGLALGIPAVLGGVINAQTPDTPTFNLLPTILTALFISFLIWRILKDVLLSSRITQERVFGAVCAYLFIGFLFTSLYEFTLLADHGAFSVSERLKTEWVNQDSSGKKEVLTYFSFVTMTTLGYGDITPVSSVARTLAWIQALIGQLYLAITIAGLVGLHIAKQRE